MAFSGSPQCKRVMAVLSPFPRPESGLWTILEAAFGAIEYKGEFLSFDDTEYYREEFGPDLYRGFIAFRGLANPEGLVDWKLKSTELEKSGAHLERRKYNLDIGYMDPDKLVLASFKQGPCKLYLKDGVYADLLLKYSQRHFQPMPWAFADFKDDRYEKSLLAIREKLKSDLHKLHGICSA